MTLPLISVLLGLLTIAAGCGGTATALLDQGPSVDGRDRGSLVDAAKPPVADAGPDLGSDRPVVTADGGPSGDVTRDSAPVADVGVDGVTDASADGPAGDLGSDGGTAPTLKTVFVILMENKNWDDIEGNPDAAYINNALLPMASFARNYQQPSFVHPSEPNYIWLEAGDRLGVFTDADPDQNGQSTTEHLVTQLQAAGISWKSYQEDISGTDCPISSSGRYAAKHNPMVFFDDVTDGNDPMSANCIAHVRPYSELSADLTNDTVARYNFITPNLCNDMHDSCAPDDNPIAQGDKWLSLEIPKILASQAYQQGGVIFITWDEAELSFSCFDGNCPIGMIILSPLAKGGGYNSATFYDHSSTLRTLQDIFRVQPYLRAAADATNLSEFFTSFP